MSKVQLKTTKITKITMTLQINYLIFEIILNILNYTKF